MQSFYPTLRYKNYILYNTIIFNISGHKRLYIVLSWSSGSGIGSGISSYCWCAGLGGFGEKFLPYSSTEIKAPSSPLALKLAAHLRSVGAKMYGAFWCSHCLEQKEMFGQEAANMLDYGECYPDGFKIGTPPSQECKEVKIRGFPMWVINMTSGRSFGC
ncbi:putative Thioredoxin-like superfamily [Helianthus annuus]|nr:putative Thioredoxin-like superfamily [Helianthus annuus]